MMTLLTYASMPRLRNVNPLAYCPLADKPNFSLSADASSLLLLVALSVVLRLSLLLLLLVCVVFLRLTGTLAVKS
jgi:hypothetical protein